ncbi:MAG: dipeptidase [Blastomonas sp.]
MRLLSFAAMISACLVAAVPSQLSAQQEDAAAIHEALLVLDTHLDTPANLDRFGWKIGDRHNFAEDATQVDLPRMEEGGLDGGFWVIYTPHGLSDASALAHGLKRSAQIRGFIADDPEHFALALTSADAAEIADSGRRIVYISMENSSPVGYDLANLEMFHQMGVRMAGPVHSGTNQFADSATGDPVHGGLSDLGKAWVREMNRLGIVIDASHASDAAFDDLLELSLAPIILSHSGPKAMLDHPRNLDDDRMRALAAKGGVMQMNSLFLRPDNPDPETSEAGDAVEAAMQEYPDVQAELIAEYAALRATRWRSDADFDTFMEALLYAISVMGVDHVGIGADWDGGGGVPGMEDITALPKITQALLERGYSADDIAKIWSGNVLRVLAGAEQVAQDVRNTVP